MAGIRLLFVILLLVAVWASAQTETEYAPLSTQFERFNDTINFGQVNRYTLVDDSLEPNAHYEVRISHMGYVCSSLFTAFSRYRAPLSLQ